MIGIGATLFKRMAGGSRFSPSSLFSSGEQGVWYDPSDLTTMFQDNTSAAPAVIGQPVGLMLDKSQGLKLGSEVITNGDFATDSDWVKGTGWSISGGVGVADNATGGNLRQNGVALEENKVYSITFTIVSISQGSVLGRFSGTPSVDSAAFTEAGTYTFFLKANSTNTSFMLRGQGGFTGTVDNVSIKEVLGNHAIQTTSVNRPVLARHPEGGIRNLLSYTQEFDDAYWTKSASVTANQATAPDGTTTADEITFPAQYSNVRSPDLITTAGVTATVSVWLKNVDGNTALRLRGSTSGGTYLQDITITNEWARYTATFTHDGTNDILFALQDGNTSNLGSVLIWGAQVEVGSTATQYQHVTDDSRYDITEPFGANSLNYLKFDGVSDGMSLTGLTSTSTPITAWFGYSATNSESGTFKYLLDIETGRTIFAASADTAGKIGYNDGAWSEFEADSNALKVLTYDLVEDNAKIRIDGTQEYSDTTYDQRAIGGDIALFQSHFTTGAFLAGNLYSCILRAAESTDKEIASTESYVAKKTGLLAQVDGLATLSLDFGGNNYTARNSNGGIL
tara:strand:- start:1863 stop:3560 length:1698 start_codon:yes stop_codon:yes gene_type:complete